MSPNKRSKEANLLEVRFVGDEDVLDHIVDKQEGFKAPKHAAQKLVTLRSEKGKQVEEETEEDVFNQQDYVEVLGTGAEDEVGNGSSGTGGADVFTFQACKRSNQMAQLAEECKQNWKCLSHDFVCQKKKHTPRGSAGNSQKYANVMSFLMPQIQFRSSKSTLDVENPLPNPVNLSQAVDDENVEEDLCFAIRGRSPSPQPKGPEQKTRSTLGTSLPGVPGQSIKTGAPIPRPEEPGQALRSRATTPPPEHSGQALRPGAASPPPEHSGQALRPRAASPPAEHTEQALRSRAATPPPEHSGQALRSSVSISLSPAGAEGRKKRSSSAGLEKLLSIISDNTLSAQPVPGPQDEMYHFALSLVPVLARLNPRSLTQAKIRILSLLDDLEQEQRQPPPTQDHSQTDRHSQQLHPSCQNFCPVQHLPLAIQKPSAQGT